MDRYGLTLVTAPTTEPITTAQFKSHSRIDITDDDTYIGLLITAARNYCETFTGRRFFTQTWDLYLDSFPSVIYVPYPPLASVSSITYVDTAGTSQTLATTEYVVDAAQEPGRIYEAYGETWPSTRDQPKAVTVRYVAGWTDSGTSLIPEAVKHAMKLIVAHWYENREPVVTGTIVANIPHTAEALLWSQRILGVS